MSRAQIAKHASIRSTALHAQRAHLLAPAPLAADSPPTVTRGDVLQQLSYQSLSIVNLSIYQLIYYNLTTLKSRVRYDGMGLRFMHGFE